MNPQEQDNYDSDNDIVICNIHTDIRDGHDRYHYSHCIYCIMDGGNTWNEEWDSWGEVAERAAKLLKMGFDDYIRGVKYNSTIPRKKHSDNVQSFTDIYKMGQDLAGQTTHSKL
jgi:hypothetical protein